MSNPNANIGLAEIRQLLVEVHTRKEDTDQMTQQFEERGLRTSIGNDPLSQGGVPVYHVYATRAGDA